MGQIDVLMGTLSKAVPAQGGYIAASHELITYLRFNARGFVFSAALSPPTAAAALAAFDVIEIEGTWRRARLMDNVNYFIGRLRETGFAVGRTASAIVPILLGSEARAFEMAKQCNLQGIYAMPVVYPAVAPGAERLRMNVTCDHHRRDLDRAVRVLVIVRAARDLAGLRLMLRLRWAMACSIVQLGRWRRIGDAVSLTLLNGISAQRVQPATPIHQYR